MPKKVRESKYSRESQHTRESMHIPGSIESWSVNIGQSESEKQLDEELEVKFQDLKKIAEEFWKTHKGKRMTPKHKSIKLEYENKLEI